MRCDEVRDLRIEWLRGRLPEERARAVDGHLVGCASCRADLEEERRLDRVLDVVPPAEAPQGFVQGVLARTAGRLARARLVRWAATVAAALLITVFTIHARDDSRLTAEEEEIVAHLDLLEDMPVVETADLVDDASAADDLDLAADVGEELY